MRTFTRRAPPHRHTGRLYPLLGDNQGGQLRGARLITARSPAQLLAGVAGPERDGGEPGS
jgi:hypothetical protein